MDDSHQGAGHACRGGVLDDVASVNNSHRTLIHQVLGSLQDLFVASAAATSDQNGNSGGDFDDFVVLADIVGRICFDDVGTEFDRLADEGADFIDVTVDHVSACLFVGLHHKGLDHQRHPGVVSLRFQLVDVSDALSVQLWLIGEEEEIDDDAGSVETDGLRNSVGDELTHEGSRQGVTVDVCNVGAKDERGFLALDVLKDWRRSGRELNCVGGGSNDGFDGLANVFNPTQEGQFIEESVVNRHVEALSVGGEESVEAGL